MEKYLLEKNKQTRLEDITRNFEKSGELSVDVATLIKAYNRPETIIHVNEVAEQAQKLAIKFNENADDAYLAGLLHDIGVIFPNEKRIEIATDLGINILPEEKECPAILHQKISQVMAKEIFDVKDEKILSAIGCHTTLKENSSVLDKIVFIADKLKWDQKHRAPFLTDVEESLNNSLDEACFRYLDYLWQQKENLAVVHPWMVAAHKQLKKV